MYRLRCGLYTTHNFYRRSNFLFIWKGQQTQYEDMGIGKNEWCVEIISDRPKDNVSCSLMFNHVIGRLFFIEPTVTKVVSFDMLQIVAIP